MSNDHEQHQRAPIVGLNASGEEALMEHHQTVPIVGLNANGEEMLMGFSDRMHLTLYDVFDTILFDSEDDVSDDVYHVFGVRPSTQISIENLERVEIEPSMEVKVCSICLDAITIGMEAIRMPEPCFHLYHQDCIVNWLNRSNTCPLCRFQMPN